MPVRYPGAGGAPLCGALGAPPGPLNAGVGGAGGEGLSLGLPVGLHGKRLRDSGNKPRTSVRACPHGSNLVHSYPRPNYPESAHPLVRGQLADLHGNPYVNCFTEPGFWVVRPLAVLGPGWGHGFLAYLVWKYICCKPKPNSSHRARNR